MYLELVDALRCPESHADAPLVASISRRADRDIIAGVLGCPICFTEYRIEDGVAIFGTGLGPSSHAVRDPHAEPPEELAVRCAAMLDLYDPGGIVVLGGAWGRAAPELLEMTRTLVVLIEPPPDAWLRNGIAAIRTGAVLPLAPGAVRGVALDTGTSTSSFLSSAVRALKPGGRLIAAAATRIPAGMIERARDDRYWVAELEATASPPIQLARNREPG